MNIPLSHYYDWCFVPDKLYNNIVNEFKDNGVSNFMLPDGMLEEFITEPRSFARIKSFAFTNKISFSDAHLPFGDPFDLFRTEKWQRQQMLEAQKRSLAFAAELGCRTCTVHLGSYDAPEAPGLRPFIVDTLGVLVEEAEQLDVVLAVENNMRSSSTSEILYYMSCFDSPHLGICYDTGHACVMSRKNLPAAEAEYGLGVAEAMLPYIVTCHLHDNGGDHDSHKMPGEGIIHWDELLAKLCSAPKLLTLQSEVSMFRNGYSIRYLVETFDRLFKK